MSEKVLAATIKHVQQARFVEYLAALAVAMFIVSIVVLFEAKTLFFQRQLAPTAFELVRPFPSRLVMTETSYQYMVDFTEQHPEIAAVGLVAVDLSENTRTTLVMLYNDKQAEERSATAVPSTVPLFTSDPVNNTEMASLLNGEFGCFPSRHSAMASSLKIVELLETSCRVPVPPYYGRLTGYLVFYTRGELSIYEVEELRRDALKLSVNMYFANAQLTSDILINNQSSEK